MSGAKSRRLTGGTVGNDGPRGGGRIRPPLGRNGLAGLGGFLEYYGIQLPESERRTADNRIPPSPDLLRYHGFIIPGDAATNDRPVQTTQAPAVKADEATEASGGEEQIASAESVQQISTSGSADGQEVRQVAAAGLEGSATALPHLESVQQAFGHNAIDHVQAHVGGPAAEAAHAMNAVAFTSGEAVGFAATPDLHTVAHEAAHVVQQRAGVSLADGVGQRGDAYERHADAVADRVVAGNSAEALLDAGMGGRPAAPTAPALPGNVQREERKGEQDDEPGFLERAGQWLWGKAKAVGKTAWKGIKATGSALWTGAKATYRTALKGVHAVANPATRAVSAIGRGAKWLGSKLGADQEGLLGLPGKALRGLGSGLEGGAEGVRDFFGLDDDGTDFTGHVEIPKDVPGDPEQQQQYSELGLPITPEAWAMQTAIDGGKLERVYNEKLLGALQRGGVLERLVESGAIRPDTIPASFSELDDEKFKEILAAVKRQLGSGRAFLERLEPEEREEFQEQVLHRYIDLAQEDEQAAFILELMPTDTEGSLGSELGDAALDGLVRGRGPDTFRVGQTVGKIRQGMVNMAGLLNEQGSNVYALPVPYANIRANIIAQGGVPADGADHLQKYLRRIGPATRTLATGYSQGGAALLDYIDRFGTQDGLDRAVALAPMGGANRGGETGVWRGERNGVDTLSVMNQADPAQFIHNQNPLHFVWSLLNFTKSDTDPSKRGEGALHSAYFGNKNHPVPPEVDQQTALAAGTFGYPTEYLQPLLRQLLAGDNKGLTYQRTGDWNHDLRKNPPWERGEQRRVL